MDFCELVAKIDYVVFQLNDAIKEFDLDECIHRKMAYSEGKGRSASDFQEQMNLYSKLADSIEYVFYMIDFSFELIRSCHTYDTDKAYHIGSIEGTIDEIIKYFDKILSLDIKFYQNTNKVMK